MARIAGITLPRGKRVVIALTAIYGIGRTRAKETLKRANVSEDTRVQALTEEQENAIRLILEKEYRVEGELRRDIGNNIKRLKDIGAYRGVRHAKRLPVRGQRTKTNSRTIRGNVRRTTL